MLILTWSESMPAIKNFLDSKAPSIPSEIFECLTLYKNNQQKYHIQIFKIEKLMLTNLIFNEIQLIHLWAT